MLAGGGDVVVDGFALAFEVARDGSAEAVVLEPVRRRRARRLEAARELVFALRARVEELQAARDAVLDALVIAGLEVQRIFLSRRAPVAAVEPATALEEDRRRNRRARALRHLDDDRAGQRGGDPHQELDVEVVPVAVAQERALGKAEDRVPQAGVDVFAGERAEGDARFLDLAPFALRLLALVGTERREEVVERAVATVVPEKAAIVPAHEAGALERGLVLVEREVDVRTRGGRVPRRLQQQGRQLVAQFVLRDVVDAGAICLQPASRKRGPSPA